MAFAPQTNDKGEGAEEEEVDVVVGVEVVEESGQKRIRDAEEEEEGIEKGTPIRYVPLCDLYSATSPCVSGCGSSNVIMSKKVKARRIPFLDHHRHRQLCSDLKPPPPPSPPSSSSYPSKPPIIHLYSRRRPKRPRNSCQKPSFFDSLGAWSQFQSSGSSTLAVVKKEQLEVGEDADEGFERSRQRKKPKKGNLGSSELIKLGVDLSVLQQLDGPRLRESRNQSQSLKNKNVSRRMRRGSLKCENVNDSQMGDSTVKRWVWYSFHTPLSK